MHVVANRRSLADIRARARAELADNPTITVYRFANGVEHRRSAYLFAGARHAFQALAVSAASAARAFSRFGDDLRDLNDYRTGRRP